MSAFKDGGSLFFRFLTNFDLLFSFHGPLLKTADASEKGVSNHRRMVCLLPTPHYEAHNLLARGCAGVFRTGACSLEHGGPKSCVRVYAGRGVCVCDQLYLSSYIRPERIEAAAGFFIYTTEFLSPTGNQP